MPFYDLEPVEQNEKILSTINGTRIGLLKRLQSKKYRLSLMALVVILGALIAPSILTAFGGTTASITTLGNQERQDIQAANQFVEGNIDFWLESHLYDAVVRIDAGTSTTVLPNTIDISYSFFFPAQNAIVVDWTQDWHVSLDQTVMFLAGSTCATPPNIVTIPKGGSSIMVPQAGSICLSANVAPFTTGNPATGWTDLSALSLTSLNSVLPIRNAPCTTVVSGLCSAGSETESSPAGEHFFRVSLSSLFGIGGVYASQWNSLFGTTFPNLPGGKSFELYFRAHLALTAVWETAIGGPGGGSQPEFCITTPAGAIRNTVDRCSWTTVSRFGAGFSPGSKNHGTVQAPGIGSKTIPLPQVVAPSGFLTVCKIVTPVENDRTGTAPGAVLTNGWNVSVSGPFGTHLSHLTGSSSLGCSKFGPLFPATNYAVGEVVQTGFVNIGTIVVPSTDRDFGTNPSPSNPVNVTLTFAEAQGATGANITFVNFRPTPKIACNCTVTIKDASGTVVNRDAIAGDTVTFTYTVTNTGNDVLTVTMTHTNTARFGPNPLFSGTLAAGVTQTVTRSTTILKGDLGTISDTVTSTGTDSFGTMVTASKTCSFIVRAPSISFVKHPVASDNVVVTPGQTFAYTISVTNGGDASATVTVSDALGAGQTLLNGGANTGAGQLPSPTPTSPAGGADYPAPVTITWSGLSVGPSQTILITFNVLVTTNVDGFVLTGLMTLTAVNANGVDYSPVPNTANDVVTVHRSILKLTQFGYTNTPTGTPTSGVVSGTTVYTVTLHNFGPLNAVVSGSLTVSVSNPGAGTLNCTSSSGPGTTLSGCVLNFSSVSLSLTADATFTLTIVYNSLADQAVVTANLAASYTTPPSTTVFVPSGTPASISFTIQAK